MDRRVWGGLVDFTGRFGLFSGWFSRDTDEGGLNGGFDAGSAGLRGTGKFYSRRQSGDAHGYLRVVALGFVVLVIAVMMGGGW
jgi:NADH-quinone oxidoreductase subunit L